MKVLFYILVAVFFCLIVLSGAVFADAVDASWAGMTMDELVDGSDAIIVGEVVDVMPDPASLTEGTGRDIGVVRVTEVISGGNIDAEVMVLFPSEKAKVRASVDITYKVGNKGVWFLRKKTGSDKGKAATLYLADHPQRLMGLEHIETVRRLIKARRLDK
ncbi:MAG: hypothetical protein AABY51_03515 [Deltaproteobacteria bacterium]